MNYSDHRVCTRNLCEHSDGHFAVSSSRGWIDTWLRRSGLVVRVGGGDHFGGRATVSMIIAVVGYNTKIRCLIRTRSGCRYERHKRIHSRVRLGNVGRSTAIA